MDEFETSFSKNYQKSQFTDEADTVRKRAGIQRKCLAQIYNYSVEKLDEQTASHLLEKNLNQSYDILDTDKDNNIKTILKSVGINQPVELKTDLDKPNIRAMLKPPLCYTDGYHCQKSEAISESDFTEFKKILKKEKPKVLLPQTNQRNTEPKVIPRSNSEETPRYNHFKSAKDELFIQNSKKSSNTVQYNQRGPRRTLGMRRNNSKFIPPLLSNENSEEFKSEEAEVEIDERLKNIDPKMVELIKNEIMDVGGKVSWDDIAGLCFAKTAIQEAVVWPMLRPDIFTGLRRPPKGILLFGPPGTGKTLIGKCVASQSKSTFFSISASSLTSKWVGEGEKMVRALFAVARCHQPAVIFIDEIDSLLSQRSESEHESSRRIKTEFLVQLDGATTDNEERILLIGATNRPQELDEAARRRFVKRLYIPLPDLEARLQLVSKLISKEKSEVSSDELEEVARMSDGYSGADIRNLCSEAALGPIRSISFSMIENIEADQVRALNMEDFKNAFTRVRSSVSQNDLEQYVVWDTTYGSGL